MIVPRVNVSSLSPMHPTLVREPFDRGTNRPIPVARQWAVITLVAGSLVLAAVALWELRTLLRLLLVAFTLAAGMRGVSRR